MKKLFALMLAVLMIATVFCACGDKTFKCDGCMEEKTGKSHSYELLGEKATLCDECYEAIAALGELGDLLG